MASPAGVLQKFMHAQSLPVTPDAELLGRYARLRDADAFAEIVRRHGPLVLGVCRRVVRDGHEAEDAFQATFLVLARRAGAVRRPERLGPWLHGVAYRVAAKARRRALRFGTPVPLDAEPPAPDDTAAAARELRPLLDDALRALPAKYREPVVLCYLQGLTNDEAARQLGCPLGTVATRLARARTQLRLHFRRRGIVVPTTLVAAAVAQVAAAVEVAPAFVELTIRQLAAPSSPGLAELVNGCGGNMLIEKARWFVVALVVAAAGGVGLVAYRAGAQDGPRPPAVEPPTASENAPEPAAPVRTENFIVQGVPTRTARLIAEAAERHRKQVAERWLGKELPRWEFPCTITATLAEHKSGAGATVMRFGGGRAHVREMKLEGALAAVLADCLPHEVTHAVLATHFGKPLPRWADEGIAISSESPEEQERHAQMFRKSLKENPDRIIRLRDLLESKDYPRNLQDFWVQSHSLASFFVGRKDRPTLLAFVKDGMETNWEKAGAKHYGFRDLDTLEKAWFEYAGLSKEGDPFAPPPDVEPGLAPKGPAPETALAVVRDGKVWITRATHVVNTVTGFRQVDQNGRKYYEPVTTYVAQVRMLQDGHALKDVTAMETDGTPVPTKKLLERLKEPLGVLLTPSGKVDPFYLQVIKPGTLILLLPAPTPAPVPVPPADGSQPPTVPAKF
jgi:RNA polymerase sigma factor (sigma-70 family)